MATINVRQLDDDVVDRLKRRASSNNRSLEGEVRHVLECAAYDDMAAKRAAFLEASDRLRRKTRGRKQTPAEVLIREDRAHGHRDDF
jgi:plasmid stability protein